MANLELIPTKPITANKAWKYTVSKSGRPIVIKYKSAEYKVFEKFITQHLTGQEFFLTEEGPLSFKAVYYVSRIDLDNCLKVFIDILEKVYGFDDKRIFEIHVRKVEVKKGSECIKFIIEPYECDDPEEFWRS